MTRLGVADLEGILSLLGEAQAIEGPAPFNTELLDRIAALARCDFATFVEVDRTTNTVTDFVLCTADRAVWGDNTWHASEDWYWTSPRSVELLRWKAASRTGPVMLSDIFSRRERTRPDFSLNFSEFGTADEIHINLDPQRGWSAEMSVCTQGEFGARERRILELVRPHLAAGYRAAALRQQLAATAEGLDPDSLEELTPREREVIHCVAEGRSNAEIARTLVVEPSTVRKHLEHIYGKLGVRNRTAALATLRAKRFAIES
jgi:DNA-binding CsgD family transcriptional regulator